jgi:hypothetical protein
MITTVAWIVSECNHHFLNHSMFHFMNTVVNRMQEDTPKFFQVTRNIGLVLAAISATILTTPIVLPALVLKIAGYVAVAGSVMGAVSQAAVKNEAV